MHWDGQTLVAAMLALGGVLLASMVWNFARDNFLPNEQLITLFFFVTAPVPPEQPYP